VPKKVFISYAWEDEKFSQEILDFSNKLRVNGIDANIDQYEENPDMGWPIWMEQQIETSDYVVVVSTKTYLDKYLQLQQGKGVSWEISSIYQSLYDLQGHNDKFIPVVLKESDREYVLKALQPYTIYNVYIQFEKLTNRIKGIKNVEKPPVTETLPLKPRKRMFVATPIDIELWDRAQWKGVAFLNIPGQGNLLGLLYDGDKDAAQEIFKQWKKVENLDDYIDICFIEGDIEGLPANGYTCLISPNLDAVAKHINSETGEFVLSINRFQRMYPSDNFAMFKHFKKIALDNPNVAVPIIPVTKINTNSGLGLDNLDAHFDDMIFVKNVRYIDAKNIGENDRESCVIPKYNSNFSEQ